MYILTLDKKFAALHKPQAVKSVNQSTEDDDRNKETIQTNAGNCGKTIISSTLL